MEVTLFEGIDFVFEGENCLRPIRQGVFELVELSDVVRIRRLHTSDTFTIRVVKADIGKTLIRYHSF